MLERGKEVDADCSLALLFGMLEGKAGEPVILSMNESPAKYKDSPIVRMIPVVSWAHAGEAESYEELPKDWQDKIPTNCTDESAFSVELHGDSMEPRFSEGDRLILMPNQKAHNGCLAVCRFKNDGVIFRRIQVIYDRIRLLPINPMYESTEHSENEFLWIYPVWARRTQIWK